MTDREKKKLIIVAGPTAAGKSGAAVQLAREIGGEIISADSVQVYRGMDIGSAKIRPEEMGGVPHHLIDILDPDEPFNVYRFKQLAEAAMEGIYRRGHIPLITGGTGFYIQAVLYDIDFEEEGGDSAYRQMLEQTAVTEEGRRQLYDQLRREDPASAAAIHPNNIRRVIRALEYLRETGGPISKHNEQQRVKESPYDFRYFVLSMDRARLYRRIEERVDRMIADGLEAETEALLKAGYDRSLPAMQSLGYRQMADFLSGEISLEEAIRRIKTETRHFAKRQLTWFRRERDTEWVDAEKENLIDVYRIRHPERS